MFTGTPLLKKTHTWSRHGMYICEQSTASKLAPQPLARRLHGEEGVHGVPAVRKDAGHQADLHEAVALLADHRTA